MSFCHFVIVISNIPSLIAVALWRLNWLYVLNNVYFLREMILFSRKICKFVAKDGEFFVTDWLRNRNTMEFLGVWERIYNPNFNYGEFATIRNQSGLNSFKISVKEFVARTGAISH